MRLVKNAWRMGYHGLSARIAVIWDTQFLPGDASAEAMQRKMANSLATSKNLQDTYLPKAVTRIRQVDAARIVGRKQLRENE